MKKPFSKTKRISQTRMKAKSGRGIKKPSQVRRLGKTRRTERSVVAMVNSRTSRARTGAARPRGAVNTRRIRIKGIALKRAAGRRSSRKAGTRKRKA
ncbi:MAG: hypothetical protein HXS52_00510 [Theionarchaea archaeon]|nr:hypothetical protein [Theionarchaea archaeon]MBU7036383.1 hypothetical protein [Theionarchaea archaeon]